MTANQICLISPIEQNKVVIGWDNKPHKRFFEQEAVQMVSAWRKMAGWLKNINIYFFNVNHAKISSETITSLSKLNCEVIEPEDIGEYKEMGFLTEPLCGKISEETLTEDFLIKIDLDMKIVNPIDSSLFELAKSHTLIESYTDGGKQNQRPCIGQFNPFDTCFIISRRDSKFYSQYFDLCHADTIRQNPEWLKLYNENGNYYLEEFVVDYMYRGGIGNIKEMRGHICGEGYVPIDELTDDEIRQINFIHNHIYHDEPTFDYQKQYITRRIRLGSFR